MARVYRTLRIRWRQIWTGGALQMSDCSQGADTSQGMGEPGKPGADQSRHRANVNARSDPGTPRARNVTGARVKRKRPFHESEIIDSLNRLPRPSSYGQDDRR